MIRDAVVSHNSPGRLRVKIAALKGDVGALTACKEQFAQCPDISAVEVNETTGSMLFLHETSMAVIAEYAGRKIFLSCRNNRGEGEVTPGIFTKI